MLGPQEVNSKTTSAEASEVRVEKRIEDEKQIRFCWPNWQQFMNNIHKYICYKNH
ncbi:hypothetical protein GCM10011383_03000 [Hymenobacter cavernae]|uniref:Uncharacterized protein n=1 Tax=Hymenobacter cavernae TaxID=2044852 RepID=A0ABQ1THQ8_9BACT|nr:hypothetical protein GCM10011383_03000 [Hymenobacter cavernae]